MKVNTDALMNLCGISCTKAEYVEALNRFVFQPARLAFVTPENIEMISRPGTPEGARHPVRYGDALVTWMDHSGKRRGVRVDAGRDAAVQLPVVISGQTQMLPFTGAAMLAARDRLPEVDPGTVNEDQRRALAGIQSVMTIIMANPDPKRFRPEIIGNAFAHAMLDALGRPELPVTIEEYGRKARADLIRAKLTRVDPDHPDGFLPHRPLQGVLDDFGIGMFSGASEIRSGRMVVNEAALRRVAAANHRLRDEVFGALTSTEVARLSAAPMTPEDFEVLKDGLANHRLTGAWITGIGERVTRIMRVANPAYRCDIAFYVIDNRDILAIRDRQEISGDEGIAYAYSWPSMDRLPAARIAGTAIVNLSPEEIPSEDEIGRLQGTLDLASFGANSDTDFNLDGVTVSQKALRRR
ncbi:hypothetical protein ACEUZ9_002792 [Paracoccus litorisediminis]|uniref:hypothetical protein n=1 Tax=Paracoccus litorisediminis TaxID=2006130 RepID=UPI0037332789